MVCRRLLFASLAFSGVVITCFWSTNALASHLVCHNVRVEDPYKDNHRIAGTAIGAVAGGLLGHQVGSGKGKTLATVGGAVAGGVVGNKVQAHHQDANRTYHIERRCHRVGD